MRTLIMALVVFFTMMTGVGFYTVATRPPLSAMVWGYSMYPEITAGDVVYGYPPKLPSDIQVGDLIVFKYKDYYVVHRVVEVRDGEYVAKGDNSNERQTVGFYDIVMEVDEVAKPGTPRYFFLQQAEWITGICLTGTFFSAIVLPRIFEEGK